MEGFVWHRLKSSHREILGPEKLRYRVWNFSSLLSGYPSQVWKSSVNERDLLKIIGNTNEKNSIIFNLLMNEKNR